LAAIYLSLCTVEEAGLDARKKAAADLLEERALELQVDLSLEDREKMSRVLGSSHSLMKGAGHTFCSSVTAALSLLNDCGLIAASDGIVSPAEERWLLDWGARAKLTSDQIEAVMSLCRRRACEVAARTRHTPDNIG
jgi:hypothetical protein